MSNDQREESSVVTRSFVPTTRVSGLFRRFSPASAAPCSRRANGSCLLAGQRLMFADTTGFHTLRRLVPSAGCLLAAAFLFAGIGRAAPTGGPLYVATDLSDGGGKTHTCAVIDGGRGVCWGDDTAGELGNGKSGKGAGLASAVPVMVKGLGRAIALGGSLNATCAVMTGGSVECWGSDIDGELGDGRSGTNLLSTTPRPVPGIGGAISISGGTGGMCAVISNGTLRCWGYNSTGGIGAGQSVSGVTAPVSLPVTGVKQVSLSGFNTGCAVAGGGTVSCWGSDVDGELGNGTVSAFPSFDPVTVSGISNARAVSAGWGFACAVLKTGSIDCWGLGQQGQLGTGKTSGAPTTRPVTVKGISNATAVSAGVGFACAVLQTGSVDCWGL